MIGGRLFGELRHCFCSFGSDIWPLFQIKFPSIAIINACLPSTEEFRPSGVDEPAEGSSQSILTSASFRGLGIGSGCGLVVGQCALAAVSFYPIRGSHYGLVSDITFCGGFVLSYRWFALGVGLDVPLSR